MVLIKMEKLTESELRNIAQDENIEDYDSLSREELIQALTEKYEDEDDNFTSDEHDGARNLRYFAGITDYREISDLVESLPGVEELPESYPETSIHLLNKNNNWGFAFWSISNIDAKKIENTNANLMLTVTKKDKNGTVEQYDIPVHNDDYEWNIGLSMLGGTCTASLVAVYPNEEREILASSNNIYNVDSYWIQHEKELPENDSLFKINLSLITTKEGDLIQNPLVEEIVSAYKREARDE